MKKLFFYLIIFCVLSLKLISQESIPGVWNPGISHNPCDIYDKENIGNRRPIQYTYLRESDVMWEKRVWRDIDMREKQNLPLYYPIEANACRTSLFQAITKNILNGNIVAFADEDFLRPYELSAIRKRLVTLDTLNEIIYKPDGSEDTVRVPVADSTSIYARVLRYRLKEDWFFDKQKSTLEARIIGIAAYEYDEEKEGFKELSGFIFLHVVPTLQKMMFTISKMILNVEV